MKIAWKSCLHGVLISALCCLPACGDNQPEKQPARPEPEPEKKAAPAVRKPVRKTFKDSEEGSLKVQLPGSVKPAPLPEVKDEHRNMSVLDKDDPAAAEKTVKISAKEKALRQSFRSKRPDGSFAAKLEPLNSGKVIRWLPQQFSELAGGVRLPAVAISPDRTVIVFAETLGELKGPFGTRLVFLDTCTWKLTAVHHLWKKRIGWIAVSPDHQLVLAALGQEMLKTQDEVIVLDPWSGREKQAVPLPGVRKVFVHPENGRVFATFAAGSERENRIAVFDRLLKKSDPAFREVKVENRNGVIGFSRDGRMICLAGDRSLEEIKDSDLNLLDKYPLPSGFETAALLIQADGSAVAAPSAAQHRPAVIFENGAAREFGSASRGILLDYPAESAKVFGAVMSHRGKICKIVQSTLEEQESIIPEDSRPRTTGDPIAVFAFAGHKALAVLDERGCFYLIYRDLSGKRWQKEILIEPAKAQ